MPDDFFKNDLLKLFPDFKKSQHFVDELMEAGSILEVESGATIIDTGEYIKVIPLLLEGLIKIYREDEEGNEILLYYINSGESCVISITASLKDEKSSIKAYVEEDSKLLAVPKDKFEYLLGKYNLLHSFTYDLFNLKYNQLIKSIDSIAFTDMRSRLMKYLLTESSVKDSQTLKGLTHKKIAQDLSSSREVISRLLYALQKDGKIKIQNKQIVIL